MAEKATEKNIQPESLEYRTEVKQLLDILAHSLYTDREIFLRELVSNASDALNRVQFEMLTNQDVVDPDVELAVHIIVDEDEKRISIQDTGIGMNREELISNLGTIAHSGAKSFLQGTENGTGEGNGSEKPTNIAEIIGQFGVGFYSAFMVAAEMTVTSRSYRPDDGAWSWISTGDSQFTLAPAEKEDRGTTIDIKLKADADEFASKWKLESIIRKHSDYVSFPIYVTAVEKPEEVDEAADVDIESEADSDTSGETEIEVKPEPKPVNKQTAIWRQQSSAVKADEYEEFYKQITYDFNGPLSHVHLVADTPADIRSILYIPSKRERGMMGMRSEEGLKLYSRKVLIQDENKDLLPEYYRFVVGVVDSEDLPLNVSREMVQSNPIMRQMKKALTGRVNRDLKRMAEKDAPTYAKFWEEFGGFIKEGVATDPSSHETLLDLLRFHSSKSMDLVEDQVQEEDADTEKTSEDSSEDTTSSEDSGVNENPVENDKSQVTDTSGLTSLKAYAERMEDDQEDIYYVLGEDLKSVELSPHLDYFRANDIEVLYMVDPIDGYMTSMLNEYNGKSLKNVDDSSLDLPDTDSKDDKASDTKETLPESEFEVVVTRFKEVLGDRVTDVQESKQLVNSPARLVTPEGSMDRDLQRIMRLTQENYEMPKKMLELNRSHPVVNNLAKIIESESGDPLINATIEQLFGNALLLEGIHPNPSEMVTHIQTLMAAAVASKAK